MSNYCKGCCYESMFTCQCDRRLCGYCERDGPLYNGPWPDYINDGNKYMYRCCSECGEKNYGNPIKTEQLESENARLRKLLNQYGINPNETPSE